jgi:branched-chain amino acid transport system substrate-binding protein
MRRLFGLAAGLTCLAACSGVLGVDDYTLSRVVQPEPSSEGGIDSGRDAGAAEEAGAEPDAGEDADAGDGGPPECAVNADCNAHGDYWVCRKSDFKCVSLVTTDCLTVLGDYKNDSAVTFGAILPTTGPDKSTGIPNLNALRLAMNDFGMVNGLPPTPGTTARRPLVLVSCSDNSDDATAERSAHHLTDDVRVPAIIGAAFSGITIKVATDVTIPAGVLLISPSATSVAITTLEDNGLVWRTVASDAIQAKADLALFPQIENDIVANLPSPRNIKVAIANKGDAYGTGLAQAVGDGLKFNGKSALSQINAADPPSGDFASFDYGDESAPNYAKAIAEITTQTPDAIFLFGTTEALTDVMVGVENDWPAGVTRPLYILSDGALVQEATDIANGNPATPDSANLRKRILGTVPGTSNANFAKFEILYESKISDGTSPSSAGTANSYDAFYTLAFDVVAAGAKPLTGANLAAGFAKQIDKTGGTIDVGSTNINSAFQKLVAGQGFDLSGASGPLDFDLATGDAPSDIEIWCLPLTAGKAGAGQATTVYYNASTSTLSGTYTQVKSDCAF